MLLLFNSYGYNLVKERIHNSNQILFLNSCILFTKLISLDKKIALLTVARSDRLYRVCTITALMIYLKTTKLIYLSL